MTPKSWLKLAPLKFFSRLIHYSFSGLDLDCPSPEVTLGSLISRSTTNRQAAKES